MKKRRIIRKLLRPGMILIYLLVITLSVVLCTYAFGGLDAALLQVKADNLAYDYSTFTNINDMDLSKLEIKVPAYDEAGNENGKRKITLEDYIDEGLAKNEILPEASRKDEDTLRQEFYEAYSLLPGEEVARNNNYIMYFNKVSTIATIYTIEKDEFNNVLPIEKLTKYYSTAVPGTTNKAANIEVAYLNEDKGEVINGTINSVSGSTNYMNTLTNEYEKHYSLKFSETGVQIAYQIGRFDAGEAYFPQKIYATMYKPEKGAFVNRRTYEYDEESEKKYEAHVENWEKYMATLGLENAMEAEYEEIIAALSNTFEEMFRGNCYVFMNKTKSNGQYKTEYRGSMRVYTREAFEYIRGLIESGEIIASYPVDPLDEERFEQYVTYGSQYDGKTNNVYWSIEGIDPSFFEEGEGKYFNCENSPLTINLKLIGDAYTKGIASESVYKLTDAGIEDVQYPFYQAQKMKKVAQLQIYNLLYNEIQYYDSIDDTLYVDKYGNPFMQGGMFEFDEDGYRVYDENGVAKITYMTLEKASDYNSMLNVVSDSSLPIFGMVLDFTLTEKGLSATLLGDSLVDASTVKNGKDVVLDEVGNTIGTFNKNFSYTNIIVLPYMTYEEVTDVNNKETGMIVVPDGSGAIINFNNGKSNMLASAVNSVYYSTDMTYVSNYKAEETMDLMLGMYGFIYTTPTNPRGILAILEKGGNQVSLYANTNDTVSRAYFSCKVRESKDISIGTSVNADVFTKWTQDLCDTDFKFNFVFLGEDEADYVSLANKYREYLIERDGIEVKDTTKDTVVDINFLGSFEKYALFLGFKYMTPKHLTTFDQATEIINELSTGVDVGDNKKLKVNEFNVSYTGWTNEEMEYQVGGSLKVSSVLGGKSDMRSFASYLDSKGIDLYPEMYVTTTKDYDLSFGNLKYTTRNVANETAKKYQFDLATQRVDKTLSATYMISPEYYSTLASSFLNKANKLNITKDNQTNKNGGYYLLDLGNLIANNYRKGDLIFGEASVQYQKDALKIISDSGTKIKLKAPYDYAIRYADFITDVPMTSTQRQIYDETIPLYQLVINGLVDYTVETINGTGSKGVNWYYAKALETGSNLSFQISYENPTVLLETDYTYYYQAYYKNWKEHIVTLASNIDTLGIHNGRLVYHENVAKNIAHVKYLLQNGSYVELYVNTTVSDYNYQGTVIPAYGYVKIA